MRRRARGLFVTGTDTGVGKTMVACAIAAWCRDHGIDAGVMKPVATGGRAMRVGRSKRWVSDDARRLARCARAADPWPLINPVCFAEPIAPWTAARRAGTTIRLAQVLEAFRVLQARHQVVIVEGIGGLLVPLTARATVADLARCLRLPLLLVARAGLGTLNHTLLSLACARDHRLAVKGVVLNHAAGPPRGPAARVSAQTNVQVLRQLAQAPILGPLPFRSDRQPLSEWIQRHLGPSVLRALMD